MSNCKSCNETDTREVCFTPNDGITAPVTLLLHIKDGNDAADNPVSVSYLSTAEDINTAIDPATYLGGGTYIPGACQLAQPDIEWSELCERLADGSVSKFFRRVVTTFDAFAAPTSVVADFELDKQTPYTVTDESQVGECGCEPLANTGLVTNINDWR